MAIVLVAGLSLAGCYGRPGVPEGSGADPAQIERVATFDASVDPVGAHATQVLADLGFQRMNAADNRYVAAFGDDRRWAFCPPVTLKDGDRRRPVLARRAAVELDLYVAPAETGTRVEIEPDFVAVYPTVDGTRTFEGLCNSYGVVEREFFNELRARVGAGA